MFGLSPGLYGRDGAFHSVFGLQGLIAKLSDGNIEGSFFLLCADNRLFRYFDSSFRNSLSVGWKETGTTHNLFGNVRNSHERMAIQIAFVTDR